MHTKVQGSTAGGTLYRDGTNLCFLDSVVQLVSRVVPEVLMVLQRKFGKPDEDLPPVDLMLLELMSVLETIAADQQAEIHELSKRLLEFNPYLEEGDQQDTTEVWNLIIGNLPDAELDFLAINERSVARCSSCSVETVGGASVRRELILRPWALDRTQKRIDLGTLLNRELETIEVVQDFHCSNPSCSSKPRRDAIKNSLAVGVTSAEATTYQEELDAFTATRTTTLEVCSQFLVVHLARSVPATFGSRKGKKSQRHIVVEVEKPTKINGALYSLVGVQRHMGSGVSRGHWTTLVRRCQEEPHSVWKEYSEATVGDVPWDRVSSKEAVVLVFKTVTIV